MVVNFPRKVERFEIRIEGDEVILEHKASIPGVKSTGDLIFKRRKK